MTKTYYTYRIRVANDERVQVEKWNPQREDLGQPSGIFRYQEKLNELTPLLQLARENTLNDSGKARQLGEILFDILFDDVLRQDFVTFYHQVVQQEKQLLRVELDIDERKMPEVAALPWEFLCLPEKSHLGTIWMGTVPDLAFSRRRAQWIAAQPIQLKPEEKLKIALVISAPPDLPTVAYEPVQKALEKLASEQANRVELLPIVNSANPEEIDKILSQAPHIFHFIGHGRLQKKGDREVGQIALIDPDFDEAMWVDADYFSELFNQHRPGVVMLPACETGMLSESQAFVGVASSIVEQNIPVVVAMQYEVSNSTASRFARRFYEKLAAEKPVDIAAQYGRRSIALGPTQYRKRDFATPVIFMRVQDGYLFKREGAKIQSSYNWSHNLNDREVNKPITRIPDNLCRVIWGRDDLIADVLSYLKSSDELSIFCLSGGPGYGKTEAAKAIANTALKQNIFDDVLWVTARDTQLVDSVISKTNQSSNLDWIKLIEEISSQLCCRNSEKDVQKYLRQNKILIVLDNAETSDYKNILAQIPKILNPSRVLLTSRVNARSTWVKPIEIKGLDQIWTKKLLLDEGNYHKISALLQLSEIHLKQIHELSCGAPLALHFVVGLIKYENEITPVLDALKKADEQVEKFDQFTLETAWQRISQDAQRVLHIMSNFPASIPQSDIVEGWNFAEQHWKKARNELRSWYLIAETSDVADIGGEKRYDLHPWIKTSVRSGLVEKWQPFSEDLCRFIQWKYKI